MQKIVNFLSICKPNSKNFILLAIALFFSATIFVLPFMNAFNIKYISIAILTVLMYGAIISILIIVGITVFYKLQKFIPSFNFKQLAIPNFILISIEMLTYSALSFALLIYPPLFLLLGLIILFSFTIFNIYVNYYLLKNKTQDEKGLFKFVKIFYTISVMIPIILWLIL